MSESHQFSFNLEQHDDLAFLIRFDQDIPPLLAPERVSQVGIAFGLMAVAAGITWIAAKRGVAE